MARDMEVESLLWMGLGLIKGNGLKALRMVRVRIMIMSLKYYIKGNGKMVRRMVMDCWSSLIASIIKVLSSNRLKTDMELKYLSMEIPTRVNIEKENSMAKGSIVGLMDLHMKVILIKVFDMEMAVGNQLSRIQIFM